MALWTDDRRFMPVGLSGLQYQATFAVPLSIEMAKRNVTQFYQAHRALLVDSDIKADLTLTRGHRWISLMSWLLPLSERWPHQTIDVSFFTSEQSTRVSISYDVKLFFTFILRPCALTKEARQLKEFLLNESVA